MRFCRPSRKSVQKHRYHYAVRVSYMSLRCTLDKPPVPAALASSFDRCRTRHSFTLDISGLTSAIFPRYFHRGKSTVIGERYVTVIKGNYRSHPNSSRANHALPFSSKSLPRKSCYPIPIQTITVQISPFLWFLVTTQPNTAQMCSSQLPYSKVE